MYKILMRSGLNDLAVIENKDFVAEAAGAQTVRDVDRGFVACYIVEFFIDLSLRNICRLLYR